MEFAAIWWIFHCAHEVEGGSCQHRRLPQGHFFISIDIYLTTIGHKHFLAAFVFVISECGGIDSTFTDNQSCA